MAHRRAIDHRVTAAAWSESETPRSAVSLMPASGVTSSSECMAVDCRFDERRNEAVRMRHGSLGGCRGLGLEGVRHLARGIMLSASILRS